MKSDENNNKPKPRMTTRFDEFILNQYVDSNEINKKTFNKYLENASIDDVLSVFNIAKEKYAINSLYNSDNVRAMKPFNYAFELMIASGVYIAATENMKDISFSNFIITGLAAGGVLLYALTKYAYHTAEPTKKYKKSSYALKRIYKKLNSKMNYYERYPVQEEIDKYKKELTNIVD